ncbi:alpha/beta hydrolase [Actinacidiphila sp. ITFR-21]|uniref:alpha/beta hydrolase n=1 Tax=Actinacidiphila sp. ITFR-21 TaxID=3075199 RepID=UPI002889D335|nr:lysophospholipase [Streptomyces sp. ITFR-21]WNI14835.1 lysophospholipase [Streptomyces sp. ITFR-21]
MTSVSTVPDVIAWDNPPHLGPRGTVVVVPGRGEDPRLYERFGSRIGADAYRVRAVADPTRWEDDVTGLIRRLRADGELPRPFVLAGSDAGALFAAGLAASGEVAVDALLLAGLPTREADAAAAARPWEDELGTRTACPTHRGRLETAGRVEHGALYTPLPPRWFERADLAAVTVPVLALHGAADEISPLDRVRPVYAAAPAAELVSLADGRHDALNDISHRTSAATVLLFLERLRAGADAPAIAVREELHP